MNIALLKLRLRKLLTCVVYHKCWRPLWFGVAPSIEHSGVLRMIDCDCVIDVGANRGQFALACRIYMPAAQIVAFEPLPHESGMFSRIHCKDQKICLNVCALGSDDSTADLNISCSSDSSSLLQIGSLQTKLFPETSKVDVVEVAVKRLDSYSEALEGYKSILLKIDVQGFELQVLHGAGVILAKCAYVYVECSEVELYSGQSLRPDIEKFLAESSFALVSRHNEHYHAGQLIQADYLFRNELYIND